MAAPVYAKGFIGNIIHVPESSYGALAVSGQYAVPAVSEALSRNMQYIDEGPVLIAGKTASRRKNLQGQEQSGGTVTYRVDYDNVKLIMEAALGTGTGTPFIITPAAEITKYTSILVDNTVERYQYLGGVIEELRIIGDVTADNGIITMEADWVFQTGAASATAALTASLTASTYAKMGEMTFRIADTADALAAGDALKIGKFLIRIKNNLRIEYASESAYIVAPIREKPRETTFEFTCPNYSDNTVQATVRAAIRAHTILQADLTWDGPGSDAIKIEIPEMYAADVVPPNLSDASTLTLPVKLNCFENVNNQTHMSSVDNDIQITLTT